MTDLCVALVLPPNRRPAEVTFYLDRAVSIRVRALYDATEPDPLRLKHVEAVPASFRGVPGLRKRVGPGACVFLRDPETLLKGVDLVISVEAFSSLSFQVSRVARKLGIPHVVQLWETLPTNPAFSLPPYGLFFNTVRDSPCTYISATKRSAQAHVSLGVPAERISTISPGSPIKASAGPHHRDGEGLDILYVGNLHAWKGLWTLMDGFTRFSQESVAAHLFVAGGGPLEADLRQAARGNPRISILGYIDEATKTRLHQSCDVFVQPSEIRTTLRYPRWEEQFGHSVVEAMHYGLPVVSSDSGALPEVVGDAGLIYPMGSGEGLSARLLQITTPELRAKLSDLALERARDEYDLDSQGKKYANALVAAASSGVS